MCRPDLRSGNPVILELHIYLLYYFIGDIFFYLALVLDGYLIGIVALFVEKAHLCVTVPEVVLDNSSYLAHIDVLGEYHAKLGSPSEVDSEHLVEPDDESRYTDDDDSDGDRQRFLRETGEVDLRLAEEPEHLQRVEGFHSEEQLVYQPRHEKGGKHTGEDTEAECDGETLDGAGAELVQDQSGYQSG